MFCMSGLKNLDLSGFKTDNVTDMSQMFDGCSGLTSLDLSGFKTDNVTDMSQMFDDCLGLTSLDLSGFKTDNVTNMHSMFSNCTGLTNLDLSGFKTVNVTDMSGMFDRCENLRVLDLSGFNTVNVTDMSGMFESCFRLTNLSLSGFKTDNVTNMKYMFFACSGLSSIDLSGFKTDNVTDMEWMFYGCSALTNLDVSGFKTENVKKMGCMFFGCSALTNLDVSGFKTNNVTDMTAMFEGCSNLTILNVSGFKTDHLTGGMFNDCYSLKTIFANENWSTAKVENGEDGDIMFDNCFALVGGNGTKYDANHIDHTYARIDKDNEPGYFTMAENDPYSGTTEAEPYAVLSEDKTVVTFYYDDQKSARGGIDINNKEIDNKSTSPYGTAIFARFDTSFADYKPTSTAYWFQSCSSIEIIENIENLKTDNVTDMRFMFLDCEGLYSLDVSGFKTDNVTDMVLMFGGCSRLKSLDVSSFKTENVTNMGGMFENCSGLTNLDVSGFKTDNVTDMSFMFKECSGLTSLDVSGFNTNNVTNMGCMFENCSGLTSLDVNGFKTDNVTYMSSVFKGCNNLTTIFAGDGWNTSSIYGDYNGNGMFSGCTSLVGGKGTKFDENHTDYTYAHIDGGKTNPGYFTDINGNRNQVLFDGLTLSVEGVITLADALEEVGGKAEVAKTIAAIVWNSTEAITNSELEGINNPNLLIFVDDESSAPANTNNVIVNGYAKSITLADAATGNNNFFAPQEFTAESISYTREFKQTTQMNVSRGWESIALPFDVQTYTHEVRGAIAPFENTDSKYHFWLHQMTENGMGMATNIEANKPYIIGMPNSDVYPEEYNLAGKVTFAAKNVTIPVTSPVTLTSPDGIVSMVPAFQAVAKSENVYVLNVGEQREEYPEGSVFECNYHDVRPFEVYSILNNVSGSRVSGARFISLSSLFGGNDGSIGIVDLKTTESDLVKVYSLNGVLLKQGKRDEIINSLPKGIYIVNGKKLIVR